METPCLCSGGQKEENEVPRTVYQQLPRALLSRTACTLCSGYLNRVRCWGPWGAGWGPSPPEPHTEALHGSFRL